MAFKEYDIPQEFIEQVKQSNNIVTVAGRYMMLKQKGRNHWACCPFHNEKTPSFSINEQDQIYKCFGCGVGGNVITLVRQLENLDFLGAIELLAKWAGLTMPKITHDPQYAETMRKKQHILEIIDAARDYYCSQLKGEPLEYLHKRGITDELIKMFNIGLSPNWDGVIDHLKGKDYTDQEIFDAGVVAKNDNGKFYDAMGQRITFAIFDIYHNCIGFTGRIMPNKDNGDVAKYRNTAQTMVFEKSNIVYGIDVLKNNKRSHIVEKLIVVEGNVDVITLVGAGFTNTVACMGTALTQFHARIFKRICSQVYICFDGDAAGKKATLRGLDILAAEDISVRVIELPDDSDPDDFLKRNGRDAFQKLIDTAKPLIDFKLDNLARGNLNDNLDKTKYLKNAVAILKEVGDPATVELYAPKAAATAGVSLESVLRSVGTLKQGLAKTQSPIINVVSDMPGAYIRALNFVVASKIYDKEYAKDDLEISIENKLYEEAIKHKISDIFDIFSEEELASLAAVIDFNFMNDEQSLAKQYRDSVNYLIKISLRNLRTQLQKQYNEVDDLAGKAKIAGEIDALNKRMKNV